MTKVSAKYDLRKYFRKILKKKVHFFYPLEISLEPKSCFCSIYHNFVINEYFDLNFAVYLAIAFHYDVLKGLFNIAVVFRVVVVVAGARSRLSFFRNRGWLLAPFFIIFLKYFDINIHYLCHFFHVKYINNLFKVLSKFKRTLNFIFSL